METIYLFLLICCFIFSIIGSTYYYKNNKFKLINLSEKLKLGWGLYKVKLKKYNNEIVISPYTEEECIYYYAKLNYQEKIINQVNKKKLDIKIYNKNKEKEFHNNFELEFLNYNILLNSKNVELSLEKKVNFDVNISMKENEIPISVEEKMLIENKEYFALINTDKSKNFDLSKIKISDDIDNYKNDFYFNIALILMPTILFSLTYLTIIR